MLVDTHCHIHEADYPLGRDEVLERARAAGVAQVICVGTSEVSSRAALDFAATRENVYAAVGVHPHESRDGCGLIRELAGAGPRLVAVGEIGLDYYYTHSPREVQIAALEEQIDVALGANLPIIFHVRDAFDDFWPVLSNFRGIKGVLHSFTDTHRNLDEALARGLYVGVNGISTFTKSPAQQQLFAEIPLDKLLLETDAPFLTPVPHRGKINEPAFVGHVAEHHAKIRRLSIDVVATSTTANARALFALR